MRPGQAWGSLGAEAWRARVVSVPQSHDNHVLSASYGIPADEGRLRADGRRAGVAAQNGERSRLYLARALLQHQARVWILDERVVALDLIKSTSRAASESCWSAHAWSSSRTRERDLRPASRRVAQRAVK